MLPEPPPGDNPLGAWCPDIDFIDRHPYVVLMNAATGTVLVVGHSNTVPDIVSALCKCVVAPIDERDYGNLYDVRIERDTEPVLSQRRY